MNNLSCSNEDFPSSKRTVLKKSHSHAEIRAELIGAENWSTKLFHHSFNYYFFIGFSEVKINKLLQKYRTYQKYTEHIRNTY